MRVLIKLLLWRGDIHLPQEFNCFFSRGSAGNCCVTQECFDNLFAHGENWVEAGHRILEDHRDVASASLSEFFRRKLEKVVFPEKDFPVQDFTWRLRYQP